MGRPDNGRKRTWRFRLDDTTTLEVSAAGGPTEKQVRRRGRCSLALAVLIAAAVVVGAAWGDNTDADGDGLAPVTNQNMAIGDINCGEATARTALIAIRRNGSYSPGTQVFAKSTNATVGVLSVTIATGDGLSAAMSGSTIIAIPANWDAAGNNTLTGTVGSLVTVDSSTPGAGSGTVTYRATGTNPGGSAINRDDEMTVTWNVLDNCAPPNQAPTVDAAGPYSGGEGSDISLSGGSASDPDGPGPLSYLWEIDASSVGTGSCSLANATSLTLATITCTDNGTATVKLTATEAGPGLSGSDTASVTIDNVAPSAEGLSASSPIDEGSTSSLTLTNPTDASSIDAASLRYSFACDGLDASLAANYAAASITNAASCPFADNGSFTVKSRVYDKDGAGTTYSSTVTVNNVPPTVVAGFTAVSVNCQTTATLTIDPDDLGLNDSPWKVNINWGDGSTEPEISRANLDSFTVTHVYALAGPYNATVSVTDKDDGTGSDLVNGVTINQTYTVDFRPPFDDSTPSGLIVNKMKNGRVVPVKATIYDDCGQAYVTDPGADVTIKVTKTSGTGSGDPVEEYADAGESSAGTSGLRWTDDSSAPGGGFWIYNLDSKALGLVVNNLYRVDLYVGTVKATASTWAVLSPVK